MIGVGRLSPGATVEQAQAELDRIGANLTLALSGYEHEQELSGPLSS
jgi:hypothetical protein